MYILVQADKAAGRSLEGAKGGGGWVGGEER